MTPWSEQPWRREAVTAAADHGLSAEGLPYSVLVWSHDYNIRCKHTRRVVWLSPVGRKRESERPVALKLFVAALKLRGWTEEES